MSSPERPLVSIILPTFNREAFLPSALESIRSQRFGDWELIVVDDGSRDGTRSLVDRLSPTLEGRVRYIYQENRGAYAARNRGLDEARGRYIAFFDSDDVWLGNHLDRCVTALEAHPEVDWVFGACRMVEHSTATVLEPSTFYPGGRPRPFLGLRARRDGDLHLVDDPHMIECQVLNGLYCGLQNSVIRARVFQDHRFDEASRVVDDEMFVVRAMAKGARFGYYLDVHVIYHVHGDNSSATTAGEAAEKQVAIFREMTRSLENLLEFRWLDAPARRAVRKRLGREYFWHLGYAILWQAGRRREALDCFKQGLAAWPWDLSAVKTYLIARYRLAIDRASS